jgi:hypothetical protein
MLARCNNPNAGSYDNYGGRGITVCREWLDYEEFRAWALANGYADDLSIDRINNDGNYEADNCRWATDGTQRRNSRRTHLLTAFGETKCCQDWAADRRCTVSYTGLMKRLRLGWEAEAAIGSPVQEGKR